ncbi:CaiB/BaiF CoA transferase family protein [Candidatus Pseudoscillospira sp. SGI.172]|uniref:CaiB/BaiF CoA transferase family protein n=1 Tax=Candidatus Pseudoscillospira sp. SGI.172 TaxID=3420582 RepID=UPI0009BA08B3|nr:CoA transferase [Pseudoflavonifractor sp.]
MSEQPYALLKGVRIIELTTYVAAPSAGRILADWGADIIKVEPTPHGDTTRFAVPLPGMKYITYDVHNANKKSIALNLKTPEGQEIMAKLLETADVLLTNTRGKALKKLGMDYETLAKKHPRLIHAHMTGFGETGPLANDPGFDNVCFWALGGPMVASMEKGTAPVIPPSSFGDNSTACTMAAAVSAALYKQKCTGEGSKVVVSLYGQAIFNMTEPVLSIQCSDLDKYPKSRLENTPLNNTYQCKDDKWIMVCCHEYERYFPFFMKIIGREELITDPEYNTFAKGNERSREIVGIIAAGFAKFERDELDHILQQYDVPHAIVANVYDLMDSRQAQENLFFNDFTINGEKFTECATPAKFGGVTLPPRNRAPFLGEQTSEIMRELGYQDGQIKELLDRGILVEEKTHAPLKKQK